MRTLVRVLPVAAVCGLLGTLNLPPDATAPELQLATGIRLLMLALLVAYGAAAALLATGRSRWARVLVLAAWAVSPAATIAMLPPDLPTDTAIVSWLAASAFAALVTVMTLTVEASRPAAAWVVLAQTLTFTAGVAWSLRQPELRVGLFVSGLLITVLLHTLAGFGVHILVRDLIAALATAERANASQRRFLANMSHEVRTPLNAIIGYAELIDEACEDEDIDAVQQDLGRILGAARHLLGILDAILDVSRIEADQVVLSAEPVPLEGFLGGVMDTTRPLAKARGLELVLEVGDAGGVWHTDPQLLRQVLLVLLTNAVQYSDRGSVTLTATRAGDQLQLAVVDQGAGIPADQLDQIFAAFERADHEVTRRRGGAGLGLAIAQRLVGLLKGQITVQSELGRGSTFTVAIPEIAG